ncbi:MAG TPA: dTMP kinase [Pseudonocardiaceae bacterium]
MSERRGFFVAIEGPSGVGKTTVTALLAQHLTDRGLSVLATKEPSDSTLGNLARHSTDDYHGLVLACLVTTDRYLHLEREVRPAFRAGCVVLCDRYVPTSLVLQRIDSVEPSFLWQLNRHADAPDLTVILTGDPAQSRARAHQRGTYSRFHRDDGGTETALYRAVARELAEAGWPVLHHEVADDPAETVAAGLLSTILERRAGRSC